MKELLAPRRAVALAILAAGLGAALAIWLAAPPAAAGAAYAPEDSKQYLREMEMYGGKANVMASALRQWFEGLWHGRRLAATIACLTPLVVLFYLIASIPLPEEPAGGPAPPGDRR